jgi:hypothetical protein
MQTLVLNCESEDYYSLNLFFIETSQLSFHTVLGQLVTYMSELRVKLGHATAQLISHQLPTVMAWV